MFWILLVALGLRLINLNQSLWLDEAIQAWAVSRFPLKELLGQFMPTDVHPPLAYLVNFFTSKLIGYSEISLRIPSVIFSLVAIMFIYKLSLVLLPKKTHLLPSLLLATSGLHIYYSQEARMYSLVVMSITASMYFFLNFLKNKKTLGWYFLFTLMALYSHYLSWLILPTQIFITWTLRSKKLKNLFLTQLFLILSFLPWLPTLTTQVKAGLQAATTSWGGVVGALSLKSLSLIPIKFLIGRISIENNLFFGLSLILPLALVFYLFIKLIKHRQKSSLAFKFIASWLIIPVILASLISLKIPVLSYTRLIFILPAFYLSLSLAISNLSSKKQFLTVISLLLINLFSSTIYLFNSNFHRENWKKLGATLVQENQSQVPVAIISSVKAPLTYYYAGNLIDFESLSEPLEHDQLWVVPYAQPIFHPDLDYHQILIHQGFSQNFKQHFRGDLTLVKYTQ